MWGSASGAVGARPGALAPWGSGWAADREVLADDPPPRQHLSSPLAAVSVTNKLCQSFQTFNICYADTGLLGAHFVCDRMNIDDMMFFLQGQW